MKTEIFRFASLYQGDCREVIPGMSADVVISDPPYGMGEITSVRGDDMNRVAVATIAPWDENFEVAAIPWPTDKVVSFTVDWRIPEWYARFPCGRLLAWRKTNPTPSIRKRMVNSAEWIFSSAQMNYREFGNSQAVISGPFDTSPFRIHPCKKPDWLMLELVEMFSLPGQTVMDPFMGSGTTGVACLKAGRRFVGVERDSRHFSTACRLLEQADRQGDLLACY